MNGFFTYIKHMSKEQKICQLAIRRKQGTPLYEGNAKGFYLVPNGRRYWRADPFVFSHNKSHYIFAEMFDWKNGKGVIGVAKLKGDRCGKFKVCLDLKHHLSYPCVFENHNGIFMIPECCSFGEINIYRCVNFPLNGKSIKPYIIVQQ